MGKIQDKEKLAEFFGAMTGDGWIQTDGRCLFLAGDPIEDREYYDKKVIPLISKLIVPVKPKNFPYWNVYGTGIYKKDIIKEILDLGFPKGKKVEIASVPSWIISSNIKTKRAFIRGLFDTDGCIFMQKDYTKYSNTFNSNYHTKSRIRITSISKRLMEEVSFLLSSLKFRHTVRWREGGFRHNRNNSSSYFVEINSIQDVHRFFKEIKPNNPKHITKYLIWKKFGFCPPKTTLSQRKDILKNAISPYNSYPRECRSGQTGRAQNALA